MTPLRAKMIKAMQVRGFSIRTHQSYLYAVADLARYFHRPPDQLGIDDLRRYFEYLATERSLSGASCRLFLIGPIGGCFVRATGYFPAAPWRNR